MTFSGNNPATKASVIVESPQTCSKPRYPMGGFQFRTGFVGNEQELERRCFHVALGTLFQDKG